MSVDIFDGLEGFDTKLENREEWLKEVIEDGRFHSVGVDHQKGLICIISMKYNNQKIKRE